MSLAVCGRQRYRELERSRGVGGWAIRSLRLLLLETIFRCVGVLKARLPRWAWGREARKTDAGLQQGEPPLALGSQGASTPRLPTTGLCVWPPLPRRNSK